MTGFILRALIAALGLWLATEWVNGVHIDSATTLVIAGLLLGVVECDRPSLGGDPDVPNHAHHLGLFSTDRERRDGRPCGVATPGSISMASVRRSGPP